jgi:hypothetical protein
MMNVRPLVIHTPTDRIRKGSEFVIRAVAALKAEGLDLVFKPIEDMRHEEAIDWYRRTVL